MMSVSFSLLVCFSRSALHFTMDLALTELRLSYIVYSLKKMLKNLYYWIVLLKSDWHYMAILHQYGTKPLLQPK